MTSSAPAAPLPLLGAAALVGLQGVGLAAFGVVELASVQSGRVTLAVTTGLFFLALGAGFVACARGLARAWSWARGPVVAVELIGVLTAFSLFSGGSTAYGVGLGATCLLGLVGVLHPASTAALAASPD